MTVDAHSPLPRETSCTPVALAEERRSRGRQPVLADSGGLRLGARRESPRLTVLPPGHYEPGALPNAKAVPHGAATSRSRGLDRAAWDARVLASLLPTKLVAWRPTLLLFELS